MPMAGNRVKNVLLSCAHDKGVGGVQVVVRDLTNWLEQNARRVHFIHDAPLRRVRLMETTNGWGRRAFVCPMPVVVRDSVLVSLPVFLAYLPIAFCQLAWVIHRKKIDVVNCHYLMPYFLHLVIAARLLRVPVVVSVHGADIDGYAESAWAHRLVYRLIMRGADRIVACSDALARRTMEVFPDVRRKVTYVHNGLDLSCYAVAPEPRPLPRPFLLCVCRHVHKKGVDTLLRAFALISPDVPDVSLVLVGDGPLLEEHKLMARTLQIEHQVVFIGNVAHEDVSTFLAACALFVLPSRLEPFGLVLLEAAHYGKGMIATRVGGVPEIITDGVDGVLVEPDEPAGMAAQILALVRQPDDAARLGVRAREMLMTRFLWKDRILDYIAIYEGRPESLADVSVSKLRQRLRANRRPV